MNPTRFTAQPGAARLPDRAALCLNRRAIIQLGAPALGLGWPQCLSALAGDAGRGRPRSDKSLIVVWTDGGISQQDTFDMKPHAPAEYRGAFRPAATSAPGIEITERFENLARVMHHVSLVRSVHHENGIHAPSAHWMLTGYFGPTLARNAPQKPCVGSVVARALGTRRSPMPAYVAIPKAEAFGYQGAVYLGKAYNAFDVGADPNAADFAVPNLALPAGLTPHSLAARRALLSRFDAFARDTDPAGVMQGLSTFKDQALDMVAGGALRAAFDLAREDPALRDRYGRHRYGQSALLARRLIEAGARCVTINTGNWDHHNDIAKALEDHLLPFDRALATLVEDLERRGMLNDVLIYCAGEFGRTPRINGHAGRDHWSDAFTVLLAGGGLAGGRVVGASETWGGGVKDRPATPQDLLATIYQALGMPLDLHFEDSSGRPVSIVGEGRPIAELA